MDFKHPLLRLAHIYERPKTSAIGPSKATYDPLIGAWRTDDGRLWVRSRDRDAPRTKKQDIETGEDQKGE